MLVDVDACVESTEIHQMGTFGREGIGEGGIALQGGVQTERVRQLNRESGQVRVRLPDPVRRSPTGLRSAWCSKLITLLMTTHENSTSPLRSSIVMV